MRKWVHRLNNKDFDNKTADCAECGVSVEIIKVGKKKPIWKCKTGRTEAWQKNRRPYRFNFNNSTIKKCEKCEIQNKDIRFFNVNHKDGDHDNNSQENLELLCPNCDRIETLKQWKENTMKKWRRSSLTN